MDSFCHCEKAKGSSEINPLSTCIPLPWSNTNLWIPPASCMTLYAMNYYESEKCEKSPKTRLRIGHMASHEPSLALCLHLFLHLSQHLLLLLIVTEYMYLYHYLSVTTVLCSNINTKIHSIICVNFNNLQANAHILLGNDFHTKG